MEWRELRRAHREHSARLGGFGDATTREFVHTVIHILQTRSPPHPSPRSGEGAPGRKPRRRSSQPMKAEGEHSNPDRERGPKPPPPPERERESKREQDKERERKRARKRRRGEGKSIALYIKKIQLSVKVPHARTLNGDLKNENRPLYIDLGRSPEVNI